MIEYCNYGDCDEIGTEPFVHRFLCKKHKEEMPKTFLGIPCPKDRAHHLCAYAGCNAYAVYIIQTKEKSPEDALFGESSERIREVCAKHITGTFQKSEGETKHSRHIEQTRETKKVEKEIEKNAEMHDEKTESLLFGD